MKRRVVFALGFLGLVFGGGAVHAQASVEGDGAAVAAPIPRILSVGEYRDRLVAIESALRGRDLRAARSEAQALSSARIAAREETIEVDRSLLGAIEKASAPTPALATRVARLVRALDRVLLDRVRTENPIPAERARPNSAAERAPAAESLERLRKAEALAPRPEGGAFPQPGEALREPAEGVASWFEPIVRALGRWLEKLFDWLFPKVSRQSSDSSFGVGASWAAIALAVAIVAYAVVALARGARRPKGRPEGSSGVPLAPLADDDPLSREASEWEIYAAELARAGRLREAVRAWYHAVLVALYRTGHAHERKGRTNWELVAMLSPSLPWRGDFADLTRRFEREWYGRDESEFAALDAAASLASGLLGAIVRKEAA